MGRSSNSRLSRDYSQLKNNDILQLNLRYYQERAKEFIDNTSSIDLIDLYREFTERLPEKNAHILDAGCGSGRDSLYFKRCGYKVTAFDASEAMVKATRRLGITAKILKLQDLNIRNKYDGIWACAVLLHIPRAEIILVLKKLWRALKPGGIIFITLKEGSGERIAPDGRYFIYYSSREFRSLLRQSGDWSEISSKKPQTGTTGTWLNFIAQKKSNR
jgi:2-polyprenyl-3-methyl-5-hydroxy-6-metoxy-1,4-benzoquinol methylase